MIPPPGMGMPPAGYPNAGNPQMANVQQSNSASNSPAQVEQKPEKVKSNNNNKKNE